MSETPIGLENTLAAWIADKPKADHPSLSRMFRAGWWDGLRFKHPNRSAGAGRIDYRRAYLDGRLASRRIAKESRP